MTWLKKVAPERWTLVEGAGAALLGGGVWARWGADWACMLWGVLLLAIASLRAWQLRPRERAE